MNLENK